MSVKTVTFKEKELLKEGYTKAGKPWAKYNYYGDDGEHYQLFDSLDLEKQYQLAQKTREFNGKTYTDWIVVPEGGNKNTGGGARAILDRLEGISADIQDIKRTLDSLMAKTPIIQTVGIDPDLPF